MCAQIVYDGKIYEACRGPAIGCISHELGCRHKTRKAAPGEGGALGGIRCGQYRSLGGIGSDAADAQLDYAPAHAVAGRACKFCVTLDLL